MMNRKFELMDKGNVHSKVTITPDRITVKIGKDECHPGFIVEAAHRIAKEITIGQAVRGVFDWSTRTITLESDVKSVNKIRKTFTF